PRQGERDYRASTASSLSAAPPGPNCTKHRAQRGLTIAIRLGSVAICLFLDLARDTVESRGNVGAQQLQRDDCRNRNRRQDQGVLRVSLSADCGNSEIRADDATLDGFHCVSPFSNAAVARADLVCPEWAREQPAFNRGSSACAGGSGPAPAAIAAAASKAASK